MSPATRWSEASFERFERSIATSTGVAEIVVRIGSDRIAAYLKPMGNRLGPHVLAAEWVGSQLAARYGLSTFDFGIIQIGVDDEITLGGNAHGSAGPAFVSKSEPGHTWSGSPRELESLLNPDDIVKMIVFDTWTLNQDRYPPEVENRRANPDNVFLSKRDRVAGQYRLLAMDHTHCFTSGRDLTDRIAGISRVKDGRLYGLFPAFRSFITRERIALAIGGVGGVPPSSIGGIIESIPSEWEVKETGRQALTRLLCERADFLSGRLADMLNPLCNLHEGELFEEGGNGDGRA